jgi:hypothetical protein
MRATQYYEIFIRESKTKNQILVLTNIAIDMVKEVKMICDKQGYHFDTQLKKVLKDQEKKFQEFRFLVNKDGLIVKENGFKNTVLVLMKDLGPDMVKMIEED